MQVASPLRNTDHPRVSELSRACTVSLPAESTKQSQQLQWRAGSLMGHVSFSSPTVGAVRASFHSRHFIVLFNMQLLQLPWLRSPLTKPGLDLQLPGPRQTFSNTVFVGIPQISPKLIQEMDVGSREQKV